MLDAGGIVLSFSGCRPPSGGALLSGTQPWAFLAEEVYEAVWKAWSLILTLT